MGKTLIQQKRGKSPRYRVPSRVSRIQTRHPKTKEKILGEVVDIVHVPGRVAPVAFVMSKNKKIPIIASEGMFVGQKISLNAEEKENITNGSLIAVGNVPEGTKIYNIELNPGDGGKLCRSAGNFAVVVSHEGEKTVLRLPSRQMKKISAKCRANIGIVAGGGVKEKPFMKAGNKFYAYKVRNKLYPKVSASAMNAVDHPFGGSNLGRSKTVSKNAPPGQKVGIVSPRRTGKK
ncbi:MAG: 50S ribosomal protein L2 [Candidatus Aenigmatarchaeota archaeon]|nr:50S ribosomal protein L2 [Candidatus Aenigmarchaeota archaeon]RLJ04832.1 MAG: 50S ribosomal protein L2 [Candidatus Aenigmarchaeota archaeon]